MFFLLPLYVWKWNIASCHNVNDRPRKSTCRGCWQLMDLCGGMHAKKCFISSRNIWCVWYREQAVRRTVDVNRLQYIRLEEGAGFSIVNIHSLWPFLTKDGVLPHKILNPLQPLHLYWRWMRGRLPEPRWPIGWSQKLLSLGCIVEKDGFHHAGEDLGHMNAHNLRDHLWEVDMCVQGLSLDEQVIGELV